MLKGCRVFPPSAIPNPASSLTHSSSVFVDAAAFDDSFLTLEENLSQLPMNPMCYGAGS